MFKSSTQVDIFIQIIQYQASFHQGEVIQLDYIINFLQSGYSHQ